MAGVIAPLTLSTTVALTHFATVRLQLQISWGERHEYVPERVDPDCGYKNERQENPHTNEPDGYLMHARMDP